MPAAETAIPPLARPVSTLYGVGPERSALLARLEIHTIEDLLLHCPRRHEDRQRSVRIVDLEVGVPAICHGQVVALGVKWFARRTRSVFELVLDDGTARLHCRWWNQPYMEEHFSKGDEVLVFGKAKGLKPRVIDHPETEVLEAGEENSVHFNRITPIYPLTEGLPQRWLRSLIFRTLESFGAHIQEPYSLPRGENVHRLPATWQSGTDALRQIANSFPSRARAIRMLHFPEAEEQVELARRRLALDEFVTLQRRMQQRRHRFESRAGALPCAGDNRLIRPFLSKLGFKLTEAQTAVLREMRKDLAGEHPMRRLLQGDVGSGKTAVAACCTLMCIESGYEVALMAPTEILAQQHFLNFTRWFTPLGVSVHIITGGQKTICPEPRESASLAGFAPAVHHAVPCPSLTVGTHALLEPAFTPQKLGLVIIDEQHKFGVAQREELLRKGHYPHLLVMTATPIPRTLGLTLYGDLDISTIDALPPGRGRIKTFVRSADALDKVWEFIKSQLGEGRQAYVIYPRVEDTGGANEVKAVTCEHAKVREQLAPFTVGLLHGRLQTAEKDEVMEAFRARRLDVLLATSLVEVGVDVPNASVMLIENAEQFGLAQLHQMRGRIGRGAHDSFCILLTTARNREARERLEVLEQSRDGFAIAEADLRLRGPGEMLGQQQSGLPPFKFGDLSRDLELIQAARVVATGLEQSGLKA